MAKLTAVLLGASILGSPGAVAFADRTLPPEQREAARHALDRVDPRYGFDPSQTMALEAYWELSLTDDMLDEQLVRLAGEIDPPARLRELYGALGNDSFLVKECLARPALVDRLSRDRFAFDATLHAEAKDRAESLRVALLAGTLDPWADHAGRVVVSGPPSRDEPVGHVSDVHERRDAFVVFVVLGATADEAVVATYVVPKIPFEAWRDSLERAGRDGPLSTIADADGSLPAALPAACTPGAVVGSADLFVLTYPSPIPVTAGELLTYTVILTNTGPDIATDTEMLLFPPEAATFESIVLPSSGRWECLTPGVGRAGKVSCTNKCFAADVPALFTITVKIDGCAGGVPARSTTLASSSTPDPFPPNNFAPTNAPVIDPGVCDDGNACTAGDLCVPVPGFAQSFDGVTAPSFPPGWTSTLVAGEEGAQPWRTSVSAWHTRPNAAFSPDATQISDSVLDSPEIPITSPAAQLTFRNFYDLERGLDGGVLEIRIGAGPFMDILDAGGSFVEGGYTPDITISGNFGSPIAGRPAWTGSVPHFMPTTVTLPATASGRTIVLRWRLATDREVGELGQWIDSIAISDRRVCLAGPLDACDDDDLCTGDSCDPALGCQHAALSCDDGLACTSDSCHPLTGCTHVAAACDDGNPCTDDTCSGVDCLHTNNAALCDDGDACTLTDVCAGGGCRGSNAVVCHDTDLCTADACDRVLRCVATTANVDATGFSAVRVDGRDLAVLAGAWNSCPGTPRYAAAVNLDRDGPCIDLDDFHRFMDTFGRSCP